MHGAGYLVYNDLSYKCTDVSYEGQFCLNSREGHGVLTKKSGDVFTGNFSNNQPNGTTEIAFANGDYYKGEVINSVMTGENGIFKGSDNKCYEGTFLNGKLNGHGRFYV